MTSIIKPANILVVRTDRFGDLVLTTPAVTALRKAFPDAQISILVSAQTRDLIVGNPDVDCVLVDDRIREHNGILGFFRLVRELRKRKFDTAFIFHTKRRTNLLCFLANIPQRIGYHDKNYGSLLTVPVPDDRHQGFQHESQYCLAVLNAVGIPTQDYPTTVAISSQAKQWVEEWINDHNLNDQLLIAVHPGASDSTKCWPIESFAQLIDRIKSETGKPVLVFGAGSTIDLARQLKALCREDFIDLTGQTTVAQSAALLKRCHLVISNDSGPVHIASAVGCYVISLFLRNQPGINPQRWRPLGAKGYILANKASESVVLDRHSQIISGDKGSITVDEVYKLSHQLIHQK